MGGVKTGAKVEKYNSVNTEYLFCRLNKTSSLSCEDRVSTPVSHQPVGPLLNSLQFIHACLVREGPKLEKAF